MKFVNKDKQDFDYVIDNKVKEYIETDKWKLVKCFTESDNYNCTLEKTSTMTMN